MSRGSRVLNVRLKGLPLIPALVAIALVATSALPASAATPAADLATSIVSPNLASAGSFLYYTITVTNKGADSASSVLITDHTPSGFASRPTTFYCVGSGTPWCSPSVLAPGVSCTAPPVGSTGTVSCTTSSLRQGASMTITLGVRVGFYFHNQIVSDTATATSGTFDPNTANNTASVWARVN